MLVNFLSALALVFIFEGIMPFLSPEKWKIFIARILTQDDKVLRLMGFISMIVGTILLTIIHQFAD